MSRMDVVAPPSPIAICPTNVLHAPWDNRTGLEPLQLVVHVLRPSRVGAVVKFHDRLAEGLPVDLDHRLALLLELGAHLLLDLDDLARGLRCRLAQDRLEG